MNVVPDDPLQGFLVAVRLRLWARQSQTYLHGFFWQVAALVLVAAAIHHWLTPVPYILLLLCSGILLAIAALRCVRGRPTLAASAAFADREFGGHALLTTAVECRVQPSSAVNDISTIVLRQASDAAQSWRPRVAAHFRSRPPTTTILAIVPLFAGMVLLSLPGKDSGGDNSRATDNDFSAIETGPLGQARSGADEIAMLRSPSGQASAPAENVSRTETGVDATRQLLPREASDGNPGADPLPVPAPLASAAGVAAANSGDDDAAGEARPSADLRSGEIPDSRRLERRELIELQRTGAIIAAGEKRNANYADAEAAETGASLDVLAAAAPETQARLASLTAAQAAYARRYLAEPGDAND